MHCSSRPKGTGALGDCCVPFSSMARNGKAGCPTEAVNPSVCLVKTIWSSWGLQSEKPWLKTEPHHSFHQKTKERSPLLWTVLISAQLHAPNGEPREINSQIPRFEHEQDCLSYLYRIAAATKGYLQFQYNLLDISSTSSFLYLKIYQNTKNATGRANANESFLHNRNAHMHAKGHPQRFRQTIRRIVYINGKRNT